MCSYHQLVRRSPQDPRLVIVVRAFSRLYQFLLVLGAASLPAQQAATDSGFSVTKVADGVYALIRTDPPGLMFEANAAFIINSTDVVVIDGGSNPYSARQALAALRKLTAKPVRYVVQTHWHDDHMMGAEVWRDAFPAADFIAHATAREDMLTAGDKNRDDFIKNAPGTVAFVRKLVADRKAFEGGVMSDEERASQVRTAELAERYLKLAPSFRPVAPTIAVDDHLTLIRGARTIEIRFLGRAHTRGDLVVHLPKEGIVIAGDLVAGPVPLVGTTSFPLEYGATLERLAALSPSVIVPGHGSVQQGLTYTRLMIDLLASITTQARAAVARGETLEQARKSVDLTPYRRAFGGDSPVRTMLFNYYVASPAVSRAIESLAQH